MKCENGVEGGSPLLACELSQEILHFFSSVFILLKNIYIIA